MIPKKIHYIWFGGNPLPPLVEKCIQSWKKFCPDYEIIRWDESNLNVDKYKFARDAYDAKKFAFASDVFRFDILANEGGIYMDVDVELLKPLDDFLQYDFFTGFEDDEFLCPGLIMGAVKNCKVLEDMIEIYKQETFNVEKLKTICVITTNYFTNEFSDFKSDGTTQHFSNKISVFSKDYFCPKNYKTGRIKITDNSYSIHHYLASWVKPKSFWGKCKQKIKQFIIIILGEKRIKRMKEKFKKNERK